jgi:carboxyl-terminal processing protease
MPLKNGGALRLTTAEYFTPSGRSIQAKGITPDIEVKPAKIEELDQVGRPHEADLKGALPNPNDPKPANIPAAGAPGQPSASAAAPTTAEAAKPDAKAPEAKEAEDAPDAAQKPAAPVDYQLARAVDLLHGVAMFKVQTVN